MRRRWEEGGPGILGKAERERENINVCVCNVQRPFTCHLVELQTDLLSPSC